MKIRSIVALSALVALAACASEEPAAEVETTTPAAEAVVPVVEEAPVAEPMPEMTDSAHAEMAAPVEGEVAPVEAAPQP